MTTSDKPELSLVLYPDPVLRRKTPTVTVFDGKLRSLAEAMFEIMAAERGIGLAAPQVGRSVRLLVAAFEEEGVPPTALVNPKVVSSSGSVVMTEGCLSFPGIFAELRRAESIRVEAQDLNGEKISIEADGLYARVLLHEMDHLDGRLFIDLFSHAQRIRTRPALRELEKAWERRKKGV